MMGIGKKILERQKLELNFWRYPSVENRNLSKSRGRYAMT